MEEYVLPGCETHTLLIDRSAEKVQFIYTDDRKFLANYTFASVKHIRDAGEDPYWVNVMALLDGPPKLLINTN